MLISNLADRIVSACAAKHGHSGLLRRRAGSGPTGGQKLARRLGRNASDSRARAALDICIKIKALIELGFFDANIRCRIAA
jgi:hypothetical protein